MKRCIESARQTAEQEKRTPEVRTLLQRRRLLPDLLSPHKSNSRRAERQAINSVIQGRLSSPPPLLSSSLLIYDDDDYNVRNEWMINKEE